MPLDDAFSHPGFKQMLERMKLSTHQYAKSQIKWIKKQLLPAAAEARALGGEVYVYVVPGGPDGQETARQIQEGKSSQLSKLIPAFLSGQRMPDPTSVGHPDAAELLQQLNNTTSVPDTARSVLFLYT